MASIIGFVTGSFVAPQSTVRDDKSRGSLVVDVPMYRMLFRNF